MENLAGNKDCDRIIERELNRAKINVVNGERSNGEVPASITGELKGFTFQRAWYYWVVKGKLSLSVAQRLHQDPVGKEDIRVNGDCGCPAPEGGYICWYSTEGNQLLPLTDKQEIEEIKADGCLSGYLNEEYKNCLFVEDPSAVGNGFVKSYHIDSEVGLRIFAEAVHSL